MLNVNVKLFGDVWMTADDSGNQGPSFPDIEIVSHEEGGDLYIRGTNAGILIEDDDDEGKWTFCTSPDGPYGRIQSVFGTLEEIARGVGQQMYFDHADFEDAE